MWKYRLPRTHHGELLRRAREKAKTRDLKTLARWLGRLHSADAAQVLESLPADQRTEVFRLLKHGAAVPVLLESRSEVHRALIADLSDREIAALVSDVPADNAVRILEMVSRSRREEIVSLIPDRLQERFRLMLDYPQSAIGRRMTRRVPIVVGPDATVEDAVNLLRAERERYVSIETVFVVDQDQLLIGVLALSRLVIADRDQTMGALMEPPPVPVHPESDQGEVARLFAAYNLLTLPVLDETGHLLGAVTVDDIVDIITAENTKEILRLGGVSGEGQLGPYWSGSVIQVVRRRFSWIILLFLAETLTGTVLRGFQNEIQAVVALSFFIPLVLSTGGNTGSQSVTTIIRGLALGEVNWNDWWRAVRRESYTGLLLGLALGVVGFLRVMLWGQPAPIATTIALTVVVITIWANAVGAVIPLAASRLRLDPAVLSAPFIATFVDATGLLIYFSIAKVVLNLHGAPS
ncbi:MAG: magnesium transporter [Chromatiales bacterium 21-64-14]|nr:MAG: magnesium transporter [Chromatiales bacterium 21-64-14]HQU16358.1 magnesium transporter [Gammaproteobacteria bacterium]